MLFKNKKNKITISSKDKKIFIINGSGGVGKDTFVQLVNEYAPIRNFSSVQLVKDIATLIGWNGTKDDKSRKFLSDLKQLTTDFNDMSFEDMKREVEEFKKDPSTIALFIHIREINEIERAKKEFDATTVLVTRKSVEPISTNKSDSNVMNYKYDLIINNDKTIEILKEEARYFAELVINFNRGYNKYEAN